MRRPTLLLLLAAATSAGAQPASASRTGKRPPLPRETEIALARSAAPPSVSAAARVLVLGDTGYVVADSGSAPVTCVVNRSWRDAIEPHCYDAEAAATVMPIELRRNTLRHLGRSEAEVARDVAEGLASGRFRLPSRPALSYMMSDAQSLLDDDGRPVGHWRPHLMLYVPYLTNAMLGLGGGAPDMRVGAVFEEGTPLASFVIVLREFVPVGGPAAPPAAPRPRR
jgi:hypothetical protein